MAARTNTFLGLEHPNYSYLCPASSRDMISTHPKGTTWVTFVPNMGEEGLVTDTYHRRYFPQDVPLYQIAVFNVKKNRWMDTTNYNEDAEPAYRYFFFDFPWVERDGIYNPKDALIAWLPYHITPSSFDVDWLLSPFVDPEDRTLRTFSDDVGRIRSYREMDPEGAIFLNERTVRARIDLFSTIQIMRDMIDTDDEEMLETATNQAIAEYEMRIQRERDNAEESDDDTDSDFVAF
jgi:hypothetical protein